MFDEITNADRAAWAADVVDLFKRLTRTDDYSALSDLLCDLHHLADERGEDWDEALRRADMHYDFELQEAM